MTAWLSRNTRPILAVLAASAVVIVGFEVLDALASSPAAPAASEEEAELGGVAVLAGLIKVTAFLGVGAGLTLLVRRLVDRQPAAA